MQCKAFFRGLRHTSNTEYSTFDEMIFLYYISKLIHFFAQFGIDCTIFMHFFVGLGMHNVNFVSSILYAIIYYYIYYVNLLLRIL